MNEVSMQAIDETREHAQAEDPPDMVGTLTRLIAGLMALAMALLMTQLR